MNVGLQIATYVVGITLCAPTAFAGDRSRPAREVYPQPYGYLEREHPYPDEFKSLVAAGIALLKAGDFEAGITKLMAAAKVHFPAAPLWPDGVPNFELWDDIGEAECKRRDDMDSVAIGLSLLTEYRCVVNMTVNESGCFVGGFPHAVPNANLSPLCFRTVCGDVWRSAGDPVRTCIRRWARRICSGRQRTCAR
jgi:hypothetical protein